MMFSRYRYLVHTSFGLEQYFEAVNKLEGAGIMYRTSVFHGTYQLLRRIDPTQYDIYVKKEDKSKAQQVIQNQQL